MSRWHLLQRLLKINIELPGGRAGASDVQDCMQHFKGKQALLALTGQWKKNSGMVQWMSDVHWQWQHVILHFLPGKTSEHGNNIPYLRGEGVGHYNWNSSWDGICKFHVLPPPLWKVKQINVFMPFLVAVCCYMYTSTTTQVHFVKWDSWKLSIAKQEDIPTPAHSPKGEWWHSVTEDRR